MFILQFAQYFVGTLSLIVNKTADIDTGFVLHIQLINIKQYM